MDYQSWNHLIASHFFKPENEGLPVYIYVSKDLLDDVGRPHGVDWEDFIKAVKKGPSEVKSRGICEKALEIFDKWKYGRRNSPPYIAYLALFVLAAASDEDENSQHCYYPRLRELLGEKKATIQYPRFSEMQKLWKDLEKWSSKDKKENLGVFKSRTVGGNIHIGFPISQTLLTDTERKELHNIFPKIQYLYGGEKNFLPSFVIKYGEDVLRRRTLRLLESNSNQDKELAQAILEIIGEEFKHWQQREKEKSANKSGEKSPILQIRKTPKAEKISENSQLLQVKAKTSTPEIPKTNKIQGSLRLCCRLDTTAEEVRMTLRCQTKHELPQNGLYLKCDTQAEFICEKHTPHWSSDLKFKGKWLNAAEFDWSNLKFSSVDQKWNFKLLDFPVRVLVNGSQLGLPGLVEVKHLPKDEPFYLMVLETDCDLIENWGKSEECKGFAKLKITKGLPLGWCFFKFEAASSNKMVKHLADNLQFQRQVNLCWQHGIEIEKDKYFYFAPPKVGLKNVQECVEVYCNEQILTGFEGVYELPLNVPIGEELLIKLLVDEEIIESKYLLLENNFSWPDEMPEELFDGFGEFQKDIKNTNSGIIGALVHNFEAPLFELNSLPPVEEGQEIIFVGREIGQIAKGPNKPKDWSAVWAIYKGKSFAKAIFCGYSLNDSEPLSRKNSKKLGEWKRFFTENGNKVIIDNPSINSLWKKYQKEAERVKIYG